MPGRAARRITRSASAVTLAAPGTTPRRASSRSVSGSPALFIAVRAHVVTDEQGLAPAHF